MLNSVCAMREEGRSAGIRRWALWIPILALTLTCALAEAITLTAVQSRKTHGAAGTFDLAIDLTQNIDGTVTVESRAIGAGHKMVFQFDQPVIAEGTPVAFDEIGFPIVTLPATTSSLPSPVSRTSNESKWCCQM